MNKLISIFLSILIVAMVTENIADGQSKREDWTQKKAKSWFEKAEWKNGWKPTPHASIDMQELAYQYHNNKELWDKAFQYLSSTNLDTIAPGKYVLDGDNLFVSVTEGPVKDFEATRFEAHRKYIDIQYIIRGKEKMGVVPFEKTTVKQEYDATKDIGFYTANEADSKYYEANPGTFLIFFPKNAHRPSIKLEGDTNKKLVVKIIAK